MSFLPNVSDRLCNITETRIQVLYENRYFDSDDPEIDDSHIHSCYEIYVNMSGDVSFLYGSDVYAIRRGDVIFSSPGDVHHCIYHSSCMHEYFCVWFDLPEDSPVARFISQSGIGGFMRYSNEKTESILATLRKLQNADGSMSFEKTVYFLDLMESLAGKSDSFHTSATALPAKVAEILAYIDENFAAIRSMEDIASRFFISVPTMNRWFREHLNLSAYKLLTAKKLSYSEKLLRGGSSVTDACFRAGFRDCSRFISLFKRQYGKTPFQYKRQTHPVGK